MHSCSRAAVARAALGAAALLASLALLAVAGAAAAQERLSFQVTVLEASPAAGGVEPAARRFDQLLGSKIRYASLHVISSASQSLALNEIGSVALPTGKAFRFRPIDRGDSGVLVSVDWERTAQGDFRLPRGKPLVFGGQPYQGGQLVVILEAQ